MIERLDLSLLTESELARQFLPVVIYEDEDGNKFCLDRMNCQVTSDYDNSPPQVLTPKQYAILCKLISTREVVFKKSLATEVWGVQNNFTTKQLYGIRVYICELRSKLKKLSPLLEKQLRTVKGIGYQWMDYQK